MGSIGSLELFPSSSGSSSLENNTSSHRHPEVSQHKSGGNGDDLLGSSSIRNTNNNNNSSSSSSSSTSTDEKNKNDCSLLSLLSQFSTAPPTAAVIGGGMAGVHVAYELARLGFDVSVFEQHPELAYTGTATADRRERNHSDDSTTVAYATGGSSTGGSLPFVGVGMLTAPLFDHTAWQHIWKGLFSRSACPNIVIRDAFFPSLLSPEFLQWRRGCGRRLFRDRDEVLLFGNRLSRVSREVVGQMVAEHPSLAPFLESSPPVKVWRALPPCSSSTSSKMKEKRENDRMIEKDTSDHKVEEVVYARNNEDGTATHEKWHSAHPSPVYLNPVGWTRALANICTSRYGVKFFTRHRLETLHVRFRQNTEMISSITISSPVDTYSPHPTGDASVACAGSENEPKKKAIANIANAPHAWVSESAEDPTRVLSTHAFDVVVLAAGGETGRLCASGTRMPILPLSSIALSVRSPSPAWEQSLRQFFPSWLSSSWSHGSVPPPSSPSPFALTALRPEANLYGYHLPIGNDCSSGKPRASSSLREAHDENKRRGEERVSVASAMTQAQPQRKPPPLSSLSPSPLGTRNEEEMCLNGLLSMDTSQKTTQKVAQKQKMLSRLRAYLSVYTGITLPEEEKKGGPRAIAAGTHSPPPQVDSTSRTAEENDVQPVSSTPSSSPSMTLQEYTIGVTPDGLPIVDSYGGFFNAFVCAGFGNRNPDWAPGAAMLLRYLVDHQAQVLRLESSDPSGGGVRAGPTDFVADAALFSPLTRTSLSRVQKTEEGLQQLFHGIVPLPIDQVLLSSSLSDVSSSLSSRRWGGFFHSVKEKVSSMRRGKTSEKTSATATTPLPSLPRDHNEEEEKQKEGENTPDAAPSAAVSWVPLRVNPYGTNRFRRLLPSRAHPDQETRSPMYVLYNMEEKYVIRYTEPLVRALSNRLLALLEADFMPTWCKDFAFFYLYDFPTPSEAALHEGTQLQHRMRDLIDTYESPPHAASSSASVVDAPLPSEWQQRPPAASMATLEKDITESGLPPFPTPGDTVRRMETGKDRAHEGVEAQSRSGPSWSASRPEDSGERMERHAREFFQSGSSSSTFRI